MIVGRVHEAGVQRTAGEEAGQAHAAGSVVVVEDAARHHLAIRLELERVHGVIKTHAHIVVRIKRPVRVDPGNRAARRGMIHAERAADDYLPVRLDGHRVDGAVRAQARVKIQIQRARFGKPGDAVARHAVELGEIARDIDHAVARIALVQRQRPNRVVRAQPGIEAQVQGAVRVHAHDAVHVQVVEESEVAGHNDLAVRLQCEGPHDVVRTVAGGKGGVQQTVRVHARQAVAGDAVVGAERAADQHAPGVGTVGVEDHRGDGRVRTRAGIKGRVQRAVNFQSGQIAATHAVVAVKIAGNNRLVVGLHDHGGNGVVRPWRVIETGQCVEDAFRVPLPVRRARRLVVN